LHAIKSIAYSNGTLAIVSYWTKWY